MDSDDKSNRDFFRFWKPRGLHSIVMIHRIYRPESMGDSAGSEVTNHSTPPEVFWLQIIKWQGSKFHSSDRLRRVKMTVGQVEYLQDLSDGRLGISDFHISGIGFIYFGQVNGTFGQVIFTIHLPDGQMHSIWNFEAWMV